MAWLHYVRISDVVLISKTKLSWNGADWRILSIPRQYCLGTGHEAIPRQKRLGTRVSGPSAGVPRQFCLGVGKSTPFVTGLI